MCCGVVELGFPPTEAKVRCKCNALFILFESSILRVTSPLYISRQPCLIMPLFPCSDSNSFEKCSWQGDTRQSQYCKAGVVLGRCFYCCTLHPGVNLRSLSVQHQSYQLPWPVVVLKYLSQCMPRETLVSVGAGGLYTWRFSFFDTLHEMNYCLSASALLMLCNL